MLLKIPRTFFKEMLYKKELTSLEKLLYIQIFLFSLINYLNLKEFSIKISMKMLAKNLNIPVNSSRIVKNNLEKKRFLKVQKMFNQYNMPEANIFFPIIPEELSRNSIQDHDTFSERKFLDCILDFKKVSNSCIELETQKIFKLLSDDIRISQKITILMLFFESQKSQNTKLLSNKKTLTKKLGINLNTLNLSLKTLQELKIGSVKQITGRLIEVEVKHLGIDSKKKAS